MVSEFGRFIAQPNYNSDAVWGQLDCWQGCQVAKKAGDDFEPEPLVQSPFRHFGGLTDVPSTYVRRTHGRRLATYPSQCLPERTVFSVEAGATVRAPAKPRCSARTTATSTVMAFL